VKYSPDGSLIAVGDMGTNHVIVLDSVTHAVLADVPVGPGPADLAFTPNGTRLLVANAGGNTVSAINIPGFSVAATIAVGSGPSRMGIRPGGAFAYVLNRRETVPGNRVSVIDLSTLSVVTTLAAGGMPHSIAFSTDGTRAIVTSVYPGAIHVIDTVAQAVMANLSTLASPAGVVFRPGLHEAIVASAGAGPACALVNADVPSAVRGQGALPARSFMVMHPDGSRIYSLSSERDSLTVLNPADGSTLDWGLLSVGDDADIGPDMGLQVLDVATPGVGPASIITADPGHALLRWDTSTDELVGSLDVGGLVKALDASPDGLHVVLSVRDSVVITEVGDITILGGPIVYPPPPTRPEVPCPAIWVPPGECHYNVVVLEDDGLNDPATSLVVDTGQVVGGERIYMGKAEHAFARF
jgi:YVTN family beta-propeller protein